MAMNPMQRRARNSFLIGFLVALIIMAIVVVFLLFRIKSINEAKEALEQANSQVYVAANDLTSGKTLNFDEDFTMETVRTTIDKSTVISSDDFEFFDEEGMVKERYNEAGERIYKELVMKIDAPAGTIVTKDMFIEAGQETSNTHRILEFNSVILPSKLKNGDYVDVRLALPSGQDYIVLAKKEVLGTTATSIWLKVDEEEMILMNNATVESYRIVGSKLYASQYVEPGMQEAPVSTYVASEAVLDLIQNNPNITQEAKDALWLRFNSNQRVTYFNPLLATDDPDEAQALVQTGIQEDVEAAKAAREEFVSELEGTEEIGYNR